MHIKLSDDKNQVELTLKMSLQQFMDITKNNEISDIDKAIINTLSQKKKLDQIVTEYLDKEGFKHHLKGYEILKRAIILCIATPSFLKNITKDLYPTLANEFSDTNTRVERAMRHAIERTYGWDRPTNSEFISMVADKLRMEGNYENI